MLLVLLAPAARRVMLPEVVMRASVAAPKLALSDSEKPSAVARLWIVSACVTVSPTCTLPKFTGAITSACARR